MSGEYRQNNVKLKIGFMPTRRNVFSKEEAGRQKKLIEKDLAKYDIELVTLDFLNDEGLLFSVHDAKRVAEEFTAKKVDAVFAAHCNFGTEDAVAKAAKLTGVPVLLWGPRDDAPDEKGLRLRDTQCGLFATSKALLRYGAPFTYLTNSWTGSEGFDNGFRRFLATVSAVKAMRKMRIGQIGPRPAPFLTVMYNEGELLERFGIEIAPISLTSIVREAQALISNNDSEVLARFQDYKKRFRLLVNDDSLMRAAALGSAMMRFAAKEDLSALCIQCWDALQDAFGIFPCFINGALADEGMPVACETDVQGAVSAALLQAMRFGETTPFFADLTVRHPENENSELLWHCGNFPPSLASDPNARALEPQYGGQLPVASRWEIQGGDITLCKLDGVRGEYKLLMGECTGTTGPANCGTYLWAQFKDWPLWEHRLIYGPYIHHIAGIHGKLAASLYEFCKYVPGLVPDPVEPAREEIEKILRS